MSGQLLYEIDQTRDQLGGLSRSTVYRLVDRGELQLVNIGRRAFVTSDSLHAYVERLKTVAA